jgi:CysZ protein
MPEVPVLKRSTLGLFGGMGALFEAVGFVVTTPAVWPLAILPVVVALVLAVGCAALGLWGATALADHLAAAASGRLAVAIAWVLRVLLGGVALLLSVVVAMSLAQPLSGFALERIARAQEKRLGGREWPEQATLPSMLRSLQVTFTALALGLPVIAALTVISIVAPPLAIVTVPLKFLTTALMIAWDFLDYPLSVRGATVSGRLRFVGAHFWAVLGFGVASGMVLLVPGVGLFLLPIGVAGATRLVFEQERLSSLR